MIKKLVAGLSVWTLTSSGLLIGKIGSNNNIVFGNYSDYISPSVAQELKNKYQLRVDLFDYDHLVKERFEKGIYDMAIVSTSVLSELKNSGAAMPLDWNKLLDDENNNGAKSSKDALELFTDIVKYMSKDLLDYGIPYFVQKLSFYYRGNPIDSIKGPISFKELVQKISEEDRFKSKNGKPKLGLIDDPRTVLSFARKIKGFEDVNPADHEYKTSREILDDYKAIINTGLSRDKLGNKFLFMTPDSGPLVDALSSGEIQGAFMYNGDGLFASIGGNSEEDIKENEFHTVELSENIFFLDFLAFSSKMPEHKKNNAYQLAKELLFISSQNESKPFEKEADSDEEDPKYKEMVAKNFHDVGYTPTLKSVYDNLKKEYFDISDVSDEEVKAETKYEILRVENPISGNLEHDYEKQLSPKNKSDMLIAYAKFKSLL